MKKIESELKLKVPQKVVKLYLQATPEQREIATQVFANFLQDPRQEAKHQLLNSLKKCQQEASNSLLTPEDLKVIFGKEYETLFK